MSQALTVDNASVHYQGKVALANVSLRIEPGEKVALIGRSGAGKSTLLSLFVKQAPATIALVPQDFGLVKTLSVFHNVYMGQLNRHRAIYNLFNLIKPLKREVESVVRVLEQIELVEKLFEPTGQLSGGQQQRTAVARALFQGSDVLMADEPVSAVDEQQSRRVLDAIVSQHNTVVLAMHDTDLAIEYADRIIGLTDGRVTLDASTTDMRSADLHEFYER